MINTRRNTIKFLLASASMISIAPIDAAIAEQPASQTLPKDWTDNKTGHRIIRLSEEEGAGVLYFYRNAYTPEGDIMVFKSPTGIGMVKLADFKVSKLLEGKENDLLFMMRTTREAVYAVTDAGTGEAEDRPKTIYAINVDTKKIRRLTRINAGRITSSNANDTMLLGQVAYGAQPLQPKDPKSISQFGNAEYAALGPDGKPLNFAKAKGVRMLQRWSARIPAELFTINIKTNTRKVIFKTLEWIGHAQFSPTDPTLIRFCYEGPWHRVDRMQLIRSDGKGLKSAHKRTQNFEIFGHEFFSHDGKWLWYDLQTPRGQVFWVAGLELATGKRVWKRLEQNEWGVHFNVSNDGNYFASDGGDADMVAHAPDGKWISLLKSEQIIDADVASYRDELITVEKFASTRLVDMSNHEYTLEPNLRFTPDGKWIIFGSNMHGKKHIYAVKTEK